MKKETRYIVEIFMPDINNINPKWEPCEPEDGVIVAESKSSALKLKNKIIKEYHKYHKSWTGSKFRITPIRKK